MADFMKKKWNAYNIILHIETSEGTKYATKLIITKQSEKGGSYSLF